MSKPIQTTIVMLTRNPEAAALALGSIRMTTQAATTHIILGAHEIMPNALLDAGLNNTADYIVPLEGHFNYSAMNNHTLASAGKHWGYYPDDQDALLFLNDDMNFCTAGDIWLAAMTGAIEAGAPVVGMKLVYPAGHRYAHRVQHAGVTPGPNLAGECRGLGADPTARAYTHPPYRNMWAVTGAALMCRAEDFAQLGGFDEGYQVISQDIDLCMALRELHDWRPAIVWQRTWALHFEGLTRGGRNEALDTEAEAPLSEWAAPDWERFHHKWMAKLPRSIIIDDETEDLATAIAE